MTDEQLKRVVSFNPYNLKSGDYIRVNRVGGDTHGQIRMVRQDGLSAQRNIRTYQPNKNIGYVQPVHAEPATREEYVEYMQSIERTPMRPWGERDDFAF